MESTAGLSGRTAAATRIGESGAALLQILAPRSPSMTTTAPALPHEKTSATTPASSARAVAETNTVSALYAKSRW